MIKELVQKILHTIKNKHIEGDDFHRFLDISEELGLFTGSIGLEKIGKVTWTFRIFGNRLEVGQAYITVIDGHVEKITDDTEKVLEDTLKKDHKELLKQKEITKQTKRLMKDGLIEEIVWYGRDNYKIKYNEFVYNMCHGRGNWIIEYSGDWEKIIDKLSKMDVGSWHIGLLINEIGGVDSKLVKIKKQYGGYKITVIRPESTVDDIGFRTLLGEDGVLEVESVEEFEAMLGFIKGD